MSTSPTLLLGSPLVLASGSPRRRELLTRARIALEVIPSHTEEAKRPGETPRQEIERLAEEKARAVAEQLGPEPARVVLGSDTGVVLDDEVLGKPEDDEHAVQLLQKLSGRTHAVITAVAIARSDSLEVSCFSVETEVVFRTLEEAAIRAYVAGGEPMDKAGAYAIQGEGRRFIASTRGSESNVIGLPVEETLQALARYGIHGGSET